MIPWMATPLFERHVSDLGRRIELVAMDRWLNDATVALYRQGEPPTAVVHSYSGDPGIATRLGWLTDAMAILGGLTDDPATRRLRFRCGAWHELAIRRVFLEACKLDTSVDPEPRPLAAADPRSSQTIEVAGSVAGEYTVAARNVTPGETNRAVAVAAGLAKLLGIGAEGATVRFPCGGRHDDLVGLLLVRAMNVRATLLELEAAATRGILAAPSQQEAGVG